MAKKEMTKAEKKALEEEISKLEQDEAQYTEERQAEIDWCTERLCQMGNRDFERYIKYLRFQRKSRAYLAEMSPDA